MDPTYKEMLDRIGNAAEGNHSITLINNSSITLWMEIGNLEKDNIRSRMYLPKKTEFTFSPYTKPFCLKEKYSKKGTLVDLYATRPEDITETSQHKSILIGGISEIKFGDTVHINYENNTLSFTNSKKSSSFAHYEKSSKTLKVARRNTLK